MSPGDILGALGLAGDFESLRACATMIYDFSGAGVLSSGLGRGNEQSLSRNRALGRRMRQPGRHAGPVSAGRSRGQIAAAQVVLFPEDGPAPESGRDLVQVRLRGLRLRHPSQWNACWLAFELWDQPQLDRFERPGPPSKPASAVSAPSSSGCAWSSGGQQLDHGLFGPSAPRWQLPFPDLAGVSRARCQGRCRAPGDRYTQKPLP